MKEMPLKIYRPAIILFLIVMVFSAMLDWTYNPNPIILMVIGNVIFLCSLSLYITNQYYKLQHNFLSMATNKGCWLSFIAFQIVLYSFYTWTPLLDSSADNTKNIIDNIGWLGVALIVVLIVPITEEIIFRLGVFDSVKVYGVAFQILFSSALFTTLHYPEQLSQIVFIFALGLILGISRFKSNGVVIPVFMHCIHNSTFLLYLWLFYD